MTRGVSRPRLAILGCGAIARLHAERLVRDGRAEVRVCCDPRRASAAALVDEFFPGAIIEDDERNAFDLHAELDAVLICSPTLRHYHHVCRALDHGLHVLCEKPLATSRDQLLDLLARAEHEDRIISVAHQRRYASAYATARRELTENADWYGPLREIHLFVCERWQQTIAGTWRDDPVVGAGYFGDAGIHQIDAIHFITGRTAQRLWASSETRGSRVQIVTRVLAEMAGSVPLSAHFVGHAHHYREDIHFHGHDGDLLLRNETVLRAKNNEVETLTDLVPPSDPVRAFLDALERGTPTVSPPEIALPIHDWTRAVLHSAATGDWIDVLSNQRTTRYETSEPR